MREGERASEESETALCPSVRLQCSNDDARSASEARLGPGVILGLKFRERSGAKIQLRGGAPHGRGRPRTADGEKVGVAIQSTGRGGRRPWRRAAGRREKVEGSPFPGWRRRWQSGLWSVHSRVSGSRNNRVRRRRKRSLESSRISAKMESRRTDVS